jgi:dimethylaniline monooxygenase (N-oxide forming)
MNSEQEITPSSTPRPRVAVIGAGASGLAAAKCLLEEQLEVVIYEQAPQIGGLWNYDDTLPDGGGAMYRSLHTNTSKDTLSFSDFPLPEHTPDFPPRSQVLEYLHDYATHFGLHASLRLNTAVESVERSLEDQWTVRARAGEQVSTERFDGVVVSSGTDCSAQIPPQASADTFTGQVLHSSGYKEPEAFAGQRIVVAGVGSSGVDIAAELSKVASCLWLSTTQSAWFIPRYLLNRPYDHLNTRLSRWLPSRLRMSLFADLILSEYRRLGITRKLLQQRGLVLPPFDLWRTRLTPCNADFLQQIQRGAIAVKPRVSRLSGQQVCFADGSAVEADTLICCTGYELRFPFLSETLLAVEHNRVALYKFVFHPDLPTLAFVGICTVLGSHIPVAEIQARWVAGVLAGRLLLPSTQEMHAEIERFRAHPSHQSPVALLVDPLEYVDEIAKCLGVRPHLWRHPRELPRWVLGPFSAAHYRLDGPGLKR